MVRARSIVPPSPEGFRIERRLPAGRYPLLAVFPGLDALPAFRRYPLSAAGRRRLAQKTTVEIIPRRGEFMYVAPHRIPKDADPRWKPVVSTTDCVVVGREHLRRSPEVVLFLDVLHELLHVVQRQNGGELWDERYTYVNRPTELEAYGFAVDEARRLAIPQRYLRDYLKVMWTSPAEHRQLLRNLGLLAPRPPRR